MEERTRARIHKGIGVLVLLGLLIGLHQFARNRNTGPEVEDTALIDLLDPQPGMMVAEVGAGGGRATVKVAKVLGADGHLYSTEINDQRLKQIKKAAAEAGLTNVTVVEGAADSANLPPDCCDAIFMSKVYHHFTDIPPMLASLRQALRPGGALVIMDFSPRFWRFRQSPPDGVPENRGGHGMPQKVLLEELQQAGFDIGQVRRLWWYWPEHRYAVRAVDP